MADILEEVIQEEKESKKYKRIKSAAPFVALAMVLSVAGAWFYNSRIELKNAENSKISASIVRLVQKSMLKDNPATDNMQDLLSSINERSESELTELGNLIYAINLLDHDKNDEGIEAVEVAAEAKNSHYVRNYARMLWIFDILDSGDEISESNKKKLEKYFDYFDDENTFCYGPVALARAHYLSINGENEEAIKLLQAAIGSDIDPGVKFQAKTLLSDLKNK